MESAPRQPTEVVGHDMAYWGRVLEEMERSLEDRDLTLHLVWPHARGIPPETPRAVAVGVATESWRVLARSSHRVRATFQAGGPAPRVAGSIRAPLVPALTALAVRARARAHTLPRVAGRLTARLRGAPREAHPVFAVPLGCHSVTDLPVTPIAERPIALSFAGSVRHWEGWWGRFTARMGAPKVRSRQEMLRAANALKHAHPNLRVEIRTTDGFMDFGPAADTSYDETSRTYWDLLMNTKICLVPSGTFKETFRHFEALRAGCAIVTDAALDGWYGRGAPFIKLRSWEDLEGAIRPLLDDEAELERHHRAALEWWSTRCSERVVGKFIAARLNELADARS